MARVQLPDRRPNVTERVRHEWATGQEQHLLVTFGFNRHGKVKEMFCADFKEGTDMHTLIGDACMVVSLLLQHGYSPADILTKMAPHPRSVLHTLVDAAAKLDEEK
jgi:hypothetical protein